VIIANARTYSEAIALMKEINMPLLWHERDEKQKQTSKNRRQESSTQRHHQRGNA